MAPDVAPARVAGAGPRRRSSPGGPGLTGRLRSDGFAVAVFFAWVPGVLLLDREAGIWFQRSLGVATWLLLLVYLRRESPLVRAQVAIVIAFATTIEYIFSPLLEVYVYRLDNVPAYVPPGHGLVYLGALILGRLPAVVRHLQLYVPATVLLLGGYAAYGLLLAERRDVLGAFWFLCLVGFLRWGRSTGLYVGAAFVVTYLEVLGTWLGIWEWQLADPTGLVAIGNPPSGAAGGYGWFDLAATLGAPTLLAAAYSVRNRWRGPSVTG